MRNAQWKPGVRARCVPRQWEPGACAWEPGSMCHGSQVRATAQAMWSEGCMRREVRAGWRWVGGAARVARGPRHAAAPSEGGRLPAPLARWSGGAHGTARHGTAGTGGGRRRGVSMGRCMGGAHERDLGALQRKPRILHLLARHLHLCRATRRACQREVRRCACRANPNRARAWTRRDRSELLARRPKAIELRLGPRFQGVRRSILCHGRRGGV